LSRGIVSFICDVTTVFFSVFGGLDGVLSSFSRRMKIIFPRKRTLKSES
jgi:hypothetical protein